ncbi:MAG: HAMP domain-containing protein [Gammaproteobacteria bacterium]|nr:HAMP domain-containing protein [Gammaproteobacteria bacterium]
MLKRAAVAIRGTVRYKLLVLVLFPILLVMPVTLMLAAYWGSEFSHNQLKIKVNTDLSVAQDHFKRIQQDYLSQLERQAESHDFQVALEVRNGASVRHQLRDLKRKAGFSYLNLNDPQGRWIFEKEGAARMSPLYLQVVKGKPAAGVEIFTEADLAAVSGELPAMARLTLVETPRSRPIKELVESRGMMIRVLYPVKDSRGNVVASLDGGVLLNGNFDFVDAIRDLVYGPGSLPEGSIGTVTLFLDDVRISTNVPLNPGERALGTRVSEEVRQRVLDGGRSWVDRSFVVNDWYISSYEPIIDVNGDRVGMLYAGFLESPFREALWHAFGMLLLMFILLMLLSAFVAVRGANSIFRPLEAMSAVVSATRDGHSRRIGPVSSRDEIGQLAREFDLMLGLLEKRSQEIRDWADQMEEKVEQRAGELQRKNTDLLRAIEVLRQTRRQLVISEKLAALGELTAGVAHEINNPTAVILGNLDIMTDELGAAAEPVHGEIDLIIQQIYRIRDIINNLLDYARPGEFAGFVGEVDVNGLVEETLKLVKHLQRETDFEIETHLEAQQHIQISREELQQVVVNLIVNGIHACGNNRGVIRISTRNWHQKGVVITVEDNGSGIDKEELSRIFNPFYSTKGQGEGTGLGLSVSYGLIRRYGGSITVRSEVGQGSCFFVWLLREPVMVRDEETITEQLHAIAQEEREIIG